MKNMMTTAFRRDIILSVLTDKAPSDAEWDEFVELVRTWTLGDTGDGALRILTRTQGGGPNAAQRGRITELGKGRLVKAAIVTSSPFARGIVTAISWFVPTNRAFAPDQLDAAYEFLELSSNERERIEAKIASMRSLLEGA